MKTVRLRFPSEAAFLAVAPEGFERAGSYPAGSAPLPEGVEALYFLGEVVVGSCMALDPEDPEGLRMVETGNPQVVSGFHVNAMGAVPEAWLPYVIEPSNPLHTFDGPVLQADPEGANP